MMAPIEDEGDDGAVATKAPTSKETEETGNQSADEGSPHGLNSFPERRLSDAARRDALENARDTQQRETKRRSLLHNRFLTRGKENAGGQQPSALSPSSHRQLRTSASSSSPTKTGAAATPQRKREDGDERPEHEDSDDDETTGMGAHGASGPVASALVVTRKRSSAAASAASASGGRGHRNLQEPASPTQGQPLLGVNPRDVIVRPPVHFFPEAVLRSSQWTAELAEDASCGLFVEAHRHDLERIPKSTLVRLEERLRRENDPKRALSSSSSSLPGPSVRLNDLVHKALTSSTTLDLAAPSPRMSVDAPTSLSAQTTTQRPKPTPRTRTAVLEVAIDRLVLDDHPTFSLADRTVAQLRALYAAYTRLLVSEPWRAGLERLDTYLEHCLRQAAAQAAPEALTTWREQVRHDVEALLLQLMELQQLHYELLGKWHELQDAYRRDQTHAARLRLESHRRAEPVALTGVRAFLELEAATATATRHPAPEDQDEDDTSDYHRRTSSALLQRVEALEAKDQCLQSVLSLDDVDDGRGAHGSSPAGNSRPGGSRPLASTNGWSSWLSRPATTTPSFYVALHVNGKPVAQTRARRWATTPGDKARGAIAFDESLRLRLCALPTSVSLTVYERGFPRDHRLSTTSIPLLVPGSHPERSQQRERIVAASLAPSVEWYQFSSTAAIPRPRWHPSFLQSTLFANVSRQVHGRVRVRVGWVAPVEMEPRARASPLASELVLLPPARAPPNGSGSHPNGRRQQSTSRLIGPRVDQITRDGLANEAEDGDLHGGRRRRRAGFSYERDFLVHMESGPSGAMTPIDRNDPDNAAVVRLQDHLRARSALRRERDVFRTSALDGDGAIDARAWATSGTRLTKRNALLQRRDREHAAKHGTSVCHALAARTSTSHRGGNAAYEPQRWTHAVFEEPVPLLEHELTADARYLGLLRPEVGAFDRQERLAEATTAELYSVDRQRKLQLLKIQDFVDRVRASQVVLNHHLPCGGGGGGGGSAAFASGAAATKDRVKTLASIIQEQPMPLLPGTLDLSCLRGLFDRRRRLRPRVQRRPVPTTAAEWPRHCNVYIQIKGAVNVPVRCGVAPGGGRTSASRKPKKKPTVQPTNASRRHRPNAGAKARDPPQDDDEEEENADDGEDVEEEEAAAASGGNKSRGGRNNNNAKADGGGGGGGDVEPSQVFVEVTFQGQRRRTSTTLVLGQGPANPSWMETLMLPFRPLRDDWSPGTIQHTQDVVRINLFDQRVVVGPGGEDAEPRTGPGVRDDGGGGGGGGGNGSATQSFHQENRYLGGLEIPFTTLYHNHGTLEATLRCEVPIVHLGYRNPKLQGAQGLVDGDDEPPRGASGSGASPATTPVDEDGVVRQSREATYVSLMMTLDPLLPPPIQDAVEPVGPSPGTGTGGNSITSGGGGIHSTGETPELVQYARTWMAAARNVNAATRERDFQVFVRSLVNGRTFLTRYLTPQAPPRFSASSTPTIPELVRFVRLLPFLEDWHLFDGAIDVWSTSQELLELNAGDYEEHAVLLCNFLLWLDRHEANRRSYLVLGRAVPEGRTVYVLRQDTYKIPQRSVLWNASTGVGYSVLDDRCPVLDVWLVVSVDNVYANVQPTTRLQELNWDIEGGNDRAWRPFFQGSTITRSRFPLPTIQRRDLTYAETPDEYVQRVELELREALKLEIRRWRSSRATTTFNIDLGLKLRAQLEALELRLQGRTPSVTTDPIEAVMRTREVSGMPLNATFTDMTRIIDMVKHANIHGNDRPGVEFALAVYVHAYPNCVLSVWVYLVSLVPRED